MGRETFLIKELIDKLELDEDDIYGIDNIPGYELIQSENLDIDLEKGYTEIRDVFRREADSKYFKVEYVDSYDYSRFLEAEAVEVFPKEVTIIIYE